MKQISNNKNKIYTYSGTITVNWGFCYNAFDEYKYNPKELLDNNWYGNNPTNKRNGCILEASDNCIINGKITGHSKCYYHNNKSIIKTNEIMNADYICFRYTSSDKQTFTLNLTSNGRIYYYDGDKNKRLLDELIVPTITDV